MLNGLKHHYSWSRVTRGNYTVLQYYSDIYSTVKYPALVTYRRICNCSNPDIKLFLPGNENICKSLWIRVAAKCCECKWKDTCFDDIAVLECVIL